MRLLILILALALAPALAQAQETPPEATPEATPTDATPTPAADAAPKDVEILMEGTDQGGFAFYIVGNPQKNPTITVEPGAKVTIRLKSVSGFHNIQVEGQTPSEYVDTGEETVYTFTAPATGGTLKYWCVPHRSSGMQGSIRVGTTAPATGGGTSGGSLVDGEIVGDAIDVPGCDGGKVPASIGEGVAGAPTMEDYQKKCAAGAETESETVDPYKSVDLVLPVSFGLIALAIVAVVWVHKSYKP